ncbi:MAG: sulfite exporter TauE/SafE family protein [Bacteroidia bacterium]|nr:sulfite exporter TauE/SafE family protein [Bacteroidia bacterium]
MEILVILLIGVIAGVFAGFIGIGGGLIIVPALVFILGMNQHMSQGTSLAMMLPPIGALAVYNYYKEGMVDIRVAAILCISFFIGGYIGSKFAIALPENTIKRIFGVIIILAGVKLIFTK